MAVSSASRQRGPGKLSQNGLGSNVLSDGIVRDNVLCRQALHLKVTAVSSERRSEEPSPMPNTISNERSPNMSAGQTVPEPEQPKANVLAT